MSSQIVDYDKIAAGYDQRYASNRLEGVAAALRQRLGRTARQTILEVGCGTGRWLIDLALLTEGNWAQGLHRIRQAVQLGESRGVPAVFEVDLRMVLVCGWRTAVRI